MLTSDWMLLCGESLQGFNVWQDGDFNPCFERLIFDFVPHVVLATCLAYHLGRHLHHGIRGRAIYSVVLHVRVAVGIALLVLPLFLLLLLFVHERRTVGLIQIATLVVKALTWLMYSGFTWKLHRLRHLPLRGPVTLVISVVFALISSFVQLRSAILYRLHHNDSLTTSEEICTYVTVALLACCLLTKIPSKRERLVSGLLNVQDSFVSEHRVEVDESRDDVATAVAEDESLTARASLFSKLFFFWVQPLMQRGSRGILSSVDDIPRLPKCLTTENIEVQFREILVRGSRVTSPGNSSVPCSCGDFPGIEPTCDHQNDCHSHTSASALSDKSISLLRALNKAFGREYYLLGILKIVSDGFSFVGPILLNFLVTFMEDRSEPLWHGYLYAGSLFMSTFLGSMFSTHFNYQILVVGLKIRAAIITTVYRKTLSVSSVTLSDFSVGEVVNFMSVDTDRIVDFCPSFHQMWSLPLQVGVALYLLYKQVGIAFLAGLAFAVILIPINRWIAIKIGELSTRMMQQKDARVKVINEILFGIRVVKFCSLEEHFTSKVGELRKAEVDSLKKRKYLDAMCVYFWATTPILISIITFTTYVFLGNKLTAAKVFTSIALFGILITPLNAFPWVINGMMEAWVSLKRLQKFMKLSEINWANYYIMNKDEADHQMAVQLKNSYFSWEHKSDSTVISAETRASNSTHCDRTDDPALEETTVDRQPSMDLSGTVGSSDTERLITASSPAQISSPACESTPNCSSARGTLRLKDINVTIKEGSFVGVVGRVGSGKSSLLSAIIGEMCKESGNIFVSCLKDGFGLTLQEAWIQQTTVRENILFGQKYEQGKYERVVEACALVPDFKILPAGDQTEVGESGMTLSGGQKARIALARSVYQEKDLYLLDDPLAAVDAHVAQHLFDHCIMGLLRDKTRILATHHTRFLHSADLILVMDHGKIVKSGLPSDLSSELESSKMADAEDKETSENENSSREEAAGSSRLSSVETGEEGALVLEEEKDSGVIKMHVYKSHWKAIGYHLALWVLISLALMQASRNVSDWWLSYWVSHAHSSHQDNRTHDSFNMLLASIADCRYQTSFLMSKSLPWKNLTDASDNVSFYLIVYGSLAGANSVFTLLRAFLFAYSGITAAKTIHRQLVNSIMKARISFFDMTPVGRIINRFSSDVYTVDDSLPFVLNIFLAQAFGILGTIAICLYGLPYIGILIALLAIIYYFIQKYYRVTSRELKRISSITQSPVYAHFSETVAGLTTIRALRQTTRFCDENRKRLESNQKAQFSSKAISQWLNIWLQMIGVVLVTGVAVVAVVERDFNKVSSGVVGLAISYVLSITSLLSGLVMFFTETEKQMVSVERTSQYINDIPPEDDSSNHHVPSSWPHEAVISFKDVCLRYRPSLPNALNGISFDLRPKEKIGIVGRTGSGKSSLFLALFRLVEIQSGQILIDGLDIHSIPLHKLRSSLAIIPQDPFLFSGSIRENLDPRSRFSDSQIVAMLDRCHILDAVQSLGGLDAEVAERGRQFSVGQRQLMCLARALLSKAQVLCIDEATANIDLKTDQLIQQTVREEFHDRTVLTIAHRLNTVMNCDRILTLSGGKVVEFAEPSYLLQKTDSVFYSFVHKRH